jgi:hypothetical protein
MRSVTDPSVIMAKHRDTSYEMIGDGIAEARLMPHTPPFDLSRTGRRRPALGSLRS